MDAWILRAAYDREASGYDAKFRAQQEPKIQAILDLCPPPEHLPVLDVGAGTGLFAAVARERAGWASTPIVSLDLSHPMLARGHAPLAIQGDSGRLPFRRGAFGLVVCVTGLVTPEQVAPALTSMCRVLVPGGLLAVSLRPRDWPESLDFSRFPLDPHHDGEAGGDRLRVFRRA